MQTAWAPASNPIQLLVENWAKIAVASVIGGLLALAHGLLTPSVYESTVTVMVSPPPFKTAEVDESDPDLKERLPELAEMMPRTLPIEMYRSIALSDGVTKKVLDEIETISEPVEALRDRLRVELVQLGSRSPVWGTQYGQAMIFYARAVAPELAAQLVQRWSQVFKQQVDQVAFSALDGAFALIEEMWTNSKSDLEDAEDELANFREQWNVQLLRQELSAKERLLTDLQVKTEVTRIAISKHQAELAVLSEQIEREKSIETLFKAPPDEAFWLSRVLAGEEPIDGKTGLRTEEFNPVFVEARQRQINTAAELHSLQAERKQSEATMARLAEQIGALQKHITLKAKQEARLERNVRTYSGTLSLLSEKLEKAKIALLNRTSDIKVVADAVVPETPIGTSLFARILLAFVIGALLGAAYILIAHSIRQAVLAARS